MSKLMYKKQDLTASADYADAVAYDNTNGKTTAENVQEALDEALGKIVELEIENAELNRNILPLGTYDIGVVFSKYHNYSCKAPTSIFRKDRYLKINSAVAESGAIDVMLDTNTENLSIYTMSDVSNQ